MPSRKDYIQQTHDILQDPDHWIKDSWGIAGAYCIVGALREVSGYITGGEQWDLTEYTGAINIISECVPESDNGYSDATDRIIVFNDRGWTTHDDVKRVLACALQKADENVG